MSQNSTKCVILLILREANVGIDYALISLMKKDSLELTDGDRGIIQGAIIICANDRSGRVPRGSQKPIKAKSN